MTAKSENPLYKRWVTMKNRALPSFAKLRPTYAGISIADEFARYEDFASWAVQQTGWQEPLWQLDKDVLLRGNRVYGAEFCVFVPREINMLLTSNKARRGKWPLGVNRDNQGRRLFRADCHIGGERVRVSGFETPEQAFEAYKNMKESHIRRVAEQYRTAIDPRVYAALVAHEIRITD